MSTPKQRNEKNFVWNVVWRQWRRFRASSCSFYYFEHKKKEKFWVRPTRSECGELQLLSAWKKDVASKHISEGHVQNFIRIFFTDLEWLLSCVKRIIRNADTIYRATLEQLLVTLGYLATGNSYHSWMYLFKILTQSFSKVLEVCDVIVSVLHEQVKVGK